MRYVIADIHGCYQEFMTLLDKIGFTDEDELYLLGDMVDRGPEPIRLLQELMSRPNIYPILGNHDYMALTVLRKLSVEIMADNAESHLTSEDITSWLHWTQDGGDVTAKQFSALTAWEKEDILDYLAECSLYEEVDAGGLHYVLVHAGINGNDPEIPLEEHHFSDFLFHRADYERPAFKNSCWRLVTGHTPTMSIRPDGKPEVYQENGHLAIDCGCVFGGQLAACCLDTGEVTYVDAAKK